MEPLAQNVKDRRIDLIISKAKVQQHKIARSALLITLLTVKV